MMLSGKFGSMFKKPESSFANGNKYSLNEAELRLPDTKYYRLPNGQMLKYISGKGAFKLAQDKTWQADPDNTFQFESDHPIGECLGYFWCDPENCKPYIMELLRYSLIMFQPQNVDFYVEFEDDEKVLFRIADNIPPYLMRTRDEFCDEFVLKWYAMALEYIRGSHLIPGNCPDFEKLNRHIDKLTLAECLDYMTYISRSGLRSNAALYCKYWKKGCLLAITERIAELTGMV